MSSIKNNPEEFKRLKKEYGLKKSFITEGNPNGHCIDLRELRKAYLLTSSKINPTHSPSVDNTKET